jgi:serine-type D-Ala-D-Ala carboxypeptidase/endopeptidase
MKPSVRTFLGILALSFVPRLLTAQATAVPTADLDSLKPRVGTLVNSVMRAGLCPGLVVGLIQPGQTRVWGYGSISSKNPLPPNADTEFEIASITKLFTQLLFSDMVHRGQMGLNDPAQKYLPPGFTLPSKGGRYITLLMLSNHTSGLPDWPEDMGSFDSGDPHNSYSLDRLYRFLSHTQLTQVPGTGFLYSCLGSSLLGDLIALKNGTTWTAILQRRVLDPLGMKDTGVTWTPDQLSRMAEGFNGEPNPPALWKYPEAFLPEGSLHSTVNDLFKLARAAMTPSGSPLADIAFDGTAQKVGWGTEVSHQGQSGDGFNSYFEVDRLRQTALVIWGRCNTDTVYQLAQHLQQILDGASNSVITLPAFTTLSKAQLKPYEGLYQIVTPIQAIPSQVGTKVSLTAAEGRLIAQGPAWWMKDFSLFPLKDGSFYIKRNGAIVTFQKDGQGRVANFQTNGDPSVTAERDDHPNAAAGGDIPPPP